MNFIIWAIIVSSIAGLLWAWSRLDIELTDGTVLLAKREVPQILPKLEPDGILSYDVNPERFENYPK